MSARPPGSTARRAVPPPWHKGSIASLRGDRRGLHSQRRMGPPAPQNSTYFLSAPRCPTTLHHPRPRGSHFGEPEPQVGGEGGGSRVCSGSLGRSGGPGYILTCYHGNGSGSVAAGRGGCSSPEMLTKGRGKGARLRQGRPWGAASIPPLHACSQGPLGGSQRRGGLSQHGPDPTPVPRSPPIQQPHGSLEATSPQASWAQTLGRPQLRPQLITWPKRGALGSEQPSQTKPLTAATSCPHGPAILDKDSPGSHQHRSAH